MKIPPFGSLLFIVLFSSLSILQAQTILAPVTIQMVYQEEGKPPFMWESPNNKGIYADIFETTAKKMGWNLEINRFPKTRALFNLMEGKGKYDFYAIRKLDESTTADETAKLYWFSTEMKRDYVYVSRIDTPEINSVEEFRKYTVLTGDLTTPLETKIKQSFGAKVIVFANAHIDRLVEGLRYHRADLFSIDSITAGFYISSNTLKDIKIQKSSFIQGLNETETLLIAFSRDSPLLVLSDNPKFDKSKPVTVDNFPVVADPKCPASKYVEELNKLYKDGTIDKIYQKNMALPFNPET